MEKPNRRHQTEPACCRTVIAPSRNPRPAATQGSAETPVKLLASVSSSGPAAPVSAGCAKRCCRRKGNTFCKNAMEDIEDKDCDRACVVRWLAETWVMPSSSSPRKLVKGLSVSCRKARMRSNTSGFSCFCLWRWTAQINWPINSALYLGPQTNESAAHRTMKNRSSDTNHHHEHHRRRVQTQNQSCEPRTRNFTVTL